MSWPGLRYALPRRIHSAAKGDSDIGELHHHSGRVGLLMFGSARESVRGNPQALSHDAETDENPRGVWTLKKLQFIG